MKILIVNDDGFRGKGLHALIRALKDDYDLTVVVPDTEQSGKSHSMTFLDPVYLDRFYLPEVDDEIYTVKGTPGDCVIMALSQIMEEPPDLLISGINKGYNAGASIVYSGTVSAAYEGASRGIPSFALSADFMDADFDLVAKMFLKIMPAILKKEGGKPFFYNINFPSVSPAELKGISKTTIASDLVTECMEKRTDPFFRDYYWHAYDSSEQKKHIPEPGSDMEALQEGYISVTPLKLDYLDREKLERMMGFSDVFAEIKAIK